MAIDVYLINIVILTELNPSKNVNLSFDILKIENQKPLLSSDEMQSSVMENILQELKKYTGKSYCTT